jgi:arylsulfatase A-like enzyme
MDSGRVAFRRAAACARPLFVLLVLGCRKEQEPAPSANPATNATNSAAVETTPRLRDFELADPREADLAFVACGAAQLGLYTRGAGPLDVTIETEGAAPTTSSLTTSREPGTPAALELPGRGARPVRVRVKAPSGTTLERARLRDEELPLATGTNAKIGGASGGDLAGALRGWSLAIVACDALNADHLKCYGAAHDTSPTIDALAAEGVRFAAMRSQSAWTVPSVTTLMTGLEQERHAVRDVGHTLAAGVPTLAEAFSSAGYATAAFLQNKLVTRETGLDRGFAQWHECVGDADHGIVPALKEFFANSGATSGPPRDSSTSASSATAKPSFLYVHFLPPHAPYTPPAPFATKFAAASEKVDGSVKCLADLNHFGAKPTDARVRQLADLYDNHVAYGDSLVADVRRMVEPRTARGEKWALLFLSDHGEEFEQHGALGHNVHVHDESVHVPLVLWAPGSRLATGRVVDAPVFTPDVFPSLVELFGLAAASGDDVVGRSFVPLVEAETRESGREVQPPTRVLHLSARHLRNGPMQRAVVFGSWKLVAPVDALPSALFDLAKDPGETTDVARDHALVAAALRGELAWWAAQPVTKSHEGFEPDAELKNQLKELGYVGETGK